MNILPYFQKYLAADFCVCAEFRTHEFLDVCDFLKEQPKISHFLSVIHHITPYTKPGIMTGGADPRIDMPAVFLPQNIQIPGKSIVFDLLCGSSFSEPPLKVDRRA